MGAAFAPLRAGVGLAVALFGLWAFADAELFLSAPLAVRALSSLFLPTFLFAGLFEATEDGEEAAERDAAREAAGIFKGLRLQNGPEHDNAWNGL